MASPPPPPAPRQGPFAAGRGPGAAAAASAEGFRIQKRKAVDQGQGDRQRQRRYEAKLNRALIELKTYYDDATAKKFGRDHPIGEFMKRYNARDYHPIVLSPTKPSATAGAKAHMGFKTQFVFESQNPELVMVHGDWELRLRGHHNFKRLPREGDFIFDKAVLAEKDLSRFHIKGKLQSHGHRELPDEDAQKLLDFGLITPQQKEKLTVESGLNFMTFTMRNKVVVKYTGSLPAPDQRSVPAVHNMVIDLNKMSPRFTLVRKSQYVLAEVDANWCHRIRVSVEKGLMPFYKHIVNDVLGYQFNKWIKRMETILPHQHWMRNPLANGQFEQYASHLAKSNFCHMKEWETILSVALIHEIEYENKCIAATFSHTIEHEAEVILKAGKYIQLAITTSRNPKVPAPKFPEGSRFTIAKGSRWVEKPKDDAPKETPSQDDEEAMEVDPPVSRPVPQPVDGSGNTPMSQAEPLSSRVAGKDHTQRPAKEEQKARFAPTQQAQPDTGASEPRPNCSPRPTAENEDEDVEMEPVSKEQLPNFQQKEQFQPAPPPAANPSPTGGGTPMQGTTEAEPEAPQTADRRKWKAKSIAKDTTRDFVISLVVENNRERKQFVLGAEYNVTLEMKRNYLPSKRQLAAIGMLASGKLGENTAYSNYLKCFILGDPLPASPAEAPIKGLKDEDKEIFERYIATLKFNGPQQEFWNSVIKSPDNANILQGPPGCGKTFMDASVAVSLALVRTRTGVCCPTNKACEAIMDALVGELDKVYELDPKKKDTHKLIFFPTTALFKEQVSAYDEELGSIVNDIVDDGDTTCQAKYRPYLLWTHIINHFKSLAASARTDGEKKNAQDWLNQLEEIRQGEGLEKKALRKWLAAALKSTSAVVKDPAVKIIVSTCSNSAQLKDFGFAPDAIIIDESAFGTEADSCVPLTLGAAHIILSGDHEQLKPQVQCLQHAEYAFQQGLPIFERVLRNGNVPLFRLKVNYRMHEEIALLAGALSYGFLACDPSTAEEEDVFKFYHDFWYSGDGAKYRHARRPSPFTKSKDTKKNIRRLFYAVKDSRFAHLVPRHPMSIMATPSRLSSMSANCWDTAKMSTEANSTSRISTLSRSQSSPGMPSRGR
jgi:hypothetical protein